MKTWWALSAVILGATAAIGACGSSEESAGDGVGGASAGATTTSSAGGAGGGGGDPGIGCQPPCEAGMICSVAIACIPEGTCVADGDCATGTVCDLATGTCVPGSPCGSEIVDATPIPPNLLVVLDRSCSMKDLVNGVKKWDTAVAALGMLTATYKDQIRFGMTLFPDLVATDCQQATFPIPVGPGNEQAMDDLLTASLVTSDPYYPNGPCVTNIDTAMEQAATEPAFLDTDRGSYALLITDGKQSACNKAGGDAGTLQIITDLLAAGVPTFVVGFGTGIDAAQMDLFAQAGGVPSAGASSYYTADDQASLDMALATIATQTLGCVFDLQSVPPDAQKIFVFFDHTQPVAKDATHGDGWDYDAATNQVTFYGAACETIKAGAVDVDIVFGCSETDPT